MRQVGNRYQNDIFKPKHINNHTNVNSINIPDQKAQIFRVNKRKQGNYFLPKRNPLKYKDTDRLKVKVKGNSLVVQWLRLCTPDTGGLGSIPGQGTRSHMPQLRFYAAK